MLVIIDIMTCRTRRLDSNGTRARARRSGPRPGDAYPFPSDASRDKHDVSNANAQRRAAFQAASR